MQLYKRCRNLPAGHCVTCSDAGCLSSIRTYLPGTVLQGCRLFKQCWILPAGHCVTGVQTISAMSEPTCRALCCSGAGCLRSVGTYLPGTVLQGCRLYKRCRNLPSRALSYSGKGCLSGVRTYLPGYVLQWCRLLKQCQNLPAGHCVTVMQTV